MNISELAQHLNLSPTTVSRALSGNAAKYRISASTAERVKRAAKEFHVAPDLLGTSLRRGKLGMVGLLVPDITNSFFSELARCIELELRQHGMTVQLCDSAEDPETEVKLLRQLLGRRLDGLIIAPVGRTSPQFVQALATSVMPVVMLDRIVPGVSVPTVSLDNAGAGRMAAEYLIERGHRRIACLRGDHESFTDRERFNGVMEALREAGHEVSAAGSAGSGYTQDASLEGARSLLCANPRPDAVVALSGQGILGILAAAEELGIRIPEDLSVVAFDEQPWSAFVNPPMTTIAQPTADMAAAATQAMLGLLRDEPVDTTTIVFAAIQPRRSVRET